ncbi:MAG TPA: hypothetical protein VGM60_09340 [Pseudonocardia sp.]|jgi:hypothetical protein|uniref:hypothetical protein n=1 Tax=Pseudonocardia sp. TaxID=60912 RepID=UPI002F40E051
MTGRSHSGLFVAEGTSDHPLADLVESLFGARGVDVNLSRPDFSRLAKVAKDVKSRIAAGCELMAGAPEVVVVHRDADTAGLVARRQEIEQAVAACAPRGRSPSWQELVASVEAVVNGWQRDGTNELR